MADPASPRPARWIHRIIGASADELPALAWSFAFFFSLLSGYYVLRGVREAMIAADPRLIPTVFTSVFVVMLLLMPAYGAIVSRFPRRTFLPIVFGIVVVSLVAFSFLFRGVVPLALVTNTFAIFISVINLFTDSVFWSFMSDIFVTQQARRFYGLIAAGGTAGAIAGPLLTRSIVHQIGVPNLLLVSAFMYGLCLVCLFRLVPWARAQETRRSGDHGEAVIGGTILAGARLVFSRPMLFALALHMFLGVSVGSIVYQEQASVIFSSGMSDAARTSFFSTIDLTINLLTLLVQVLLTRTIMVRFGVAPMLLVPAILLVVGMGTLALAFSSMLLIAVQVTTRSLSFSLVKPGRESLYTQVDREARYKAKNFIDTVVYRGGDMTTSWVFYGLAQGLGFGLAAIAGVGAAVAMLWLLVVVWLVKLQRDLPERTATDPA